MAFKPDCKIKYKKVEGNSLLSTKNFLIAYKAINQYNTILNLNLFRNMVTYITEKANEKGYFPNRLIKEEQNATKAVFDIPSFKKLDGINEQANKIVEEVTQPDLFTVLSSQIDNQIDYSLKITSALQNSNVRQPNKNIQGFYNDLQKQGVSKEQIEIVKSLNPENKTKEELIVDLQSNYSFAVEVNIAQDFNKDGAKNYNSFDLNGKRYSRGIDDEVGQFYQYFDLVTKQFVDISQYEYEKALNDIKLKDEKSPTQYYSNLTVPGGEEGTYREINIESPLIKLPRSHGQFNTENTLMFSRVDNSKVYSENDIESLISTMEKNGVLKIEC